MNIENLNEVESYIAKNKDTIMTKCSIILGKKIDMASFNGTIGSKNPTYNVNMENCSKASEYVNAWFDGFKRLLQSEKDFESLPTLETKDKREKSVHRMNMLLNDIDVKKFIIVYLARTYLRKSNKQN